MIMTTKKDIQVIDFKKLPVDFSSIGIDDAMLAKLKEEYGIVPDCSKKEGYAIVKAGLAKFRAFRSKIEVKRKELNEDAVDYKKRVDTEAKRIIDSVVALEEPMKEARKAEDAIKEEEKRIKAEKEKERIAAIEKEVNTIRNVVLDCHGKDSSELSVIIGILEKTEIGIDRFAEHTPVAEAAKIEAIERLEELRDQALANEKADEERKVEDARLAEERKKFEAEQEETRKKEEAATIEREKEAQDLADKEEELRKKQEAETLETERVNTIKEKIQAIKDRGAYDPEATAEQIEGRINVLENITPRKDTFGEYTNDACEAMEVALTALRAFHDMKVEQERVAAAKAEEEAKKAAEEETAKEVEAPPEEEKTEDTPPDDDVVDAEFVPEEYTPSDDDEERIEFVNALVDLFPVVPTPTANGIYRALKKGSIPFTFKFTGGE